MAQNQSKTSKKPPAMDSTDTKRKLNDISKILPEEELVRDEPPQKVNPPEQEKPTGSIAKMVCWMVNFVCNRAGYALLSDNEVSLLSEPINEIEVRYLSPLMRRYAAQTSPFLQLGIVGYGIYQTRKQQSPPIENPPANAEETAQPADNTQEALQ